ncbi:hypothetical protein K7432_005625 [Basidiobolus ranarum]|uniref:Uncharacterized protein n=1 Tax=Basidiobolus ranarum TaxID=34480 RepID=A0ABR2W3R0_9FUNG
MKHKKKYQLHTYDEETFEENDKPVWHGIKRDGSPTELQSKKKRGSKSEQADKRLILQDTLDNEIQFRLKNKIRACLNQNKSVEDLKKACLDMKRIERDTVADAERKAGLDYGSITSYIRNSQKANITFWTDVVNSHFDEMVLLVRLELSTISDSMKGSSSRATADSDTMEAEVDDIIKIVGCPKSSTRVCTAPFKKMIRPDLPTDIKEWIEEVFKNTINGVNDYLIELGITVYKLLLTLTDHTHFMHGEEIKLVQQNGAPLSAVLPSWCLQSQSDGSLPPPMSLNCTRNENFNNSLSELFNSSQFSIVNSNYFGKKGAQKSSMDSNHMLKAFLDEVPKNEEQQQIDTNVMRLAAAQYITYLQNDRQTIYKEKAKNDHSNLAKWNDKLSKSEKRENYLAKRLNYERLILKSNDCKNTPTKVQEENELEDSDTDLTSERISDLKDIIKGILLRGNDKAVLTESDLSSSGNNLIGEEAKVVLLILNTIYPYIPKKGKRYLFSYQLPFLLMANQLFRTTNYHKYKVKLCPLTKPGSLRSIRLDSACLYSLFSSESVTFKRLVLYDNEHKQITSKDKALQQKNAVFGSFFSLKKLFDVCYEYGLAFDHSIVLLPVQWRNEVQFDDYDKKMSSLPKTIVTKSEEVKQRSGNYRRENSLSRRKNSTVGKDVKTLKPTRRINHF